MTAKTAAVLVAFLLAATAVPSLASDPPLTPTRVQGVVIVSPEEARALLGKARFYDMRSAVNYGKGHIKGAVALPYEGRSENAESFDASQDRFDAAKLPPDKRTQIVFYSDGPRGWKSYKAAVQASRAGYTNVGWMREGTAGWTAKGYPLE